MTQWWGVGVLALLCLVMSDDAHADGESDRRKYIYEIEKLLEGMQGDLERVVSDSGTGYVEYAIRKADEIKDQIRNLDGVKGDDSQAKEWVSRYPGYADKFKESARYLKELKQGQRQLDEWPKKCEERMKELLEKVRAYTAIHDPRGLEEVPKLAREYGRTGKELLEQAERKRYEMQQWYERAVYFSESDGKWSYVKTSLHSASRGVYEYLTKVQDRMKRDDVCGDLAKEERNPHVEREMAKLFEGKKGLEMIYEQLDRQLGEAASYLNDLEGDSSASDVDSAVSKADELERSYEQLDRTRGRDDEARRRLEVGRSTLRVYREALKHLKVLKQGQFLVDRAEEKCREAEDKLREAVRSYTDSKNSKGVKEIPLKARAIGEGIKAAVQKADEQHKIMETERNESLRFDAGEGRWREVRDNMKESTNAIWDHWKRAWETAHGKCDALAKGEGHELVKMALEQLKGGAKSLAEAFRKDVDAWFDLTRESFKMDCAAMTELWEATCGVDWEKDASIGAAAAKVVAERIARERGDDGRKLLELYEELKKRGELLEKDDEIGNDAKQLNENMRKRRYGAVKTMIEGGAGRGWQNPLIQFAQRYGIERHLDMMTSSSWGCDVADEPIPGTGSGEDPGRPDCINADKCIIYEFKPDSPTGQAAYREQEGRYKAGVNEFFTKHLSGGTVPSIKGGQAIIDKLKKNASCWDTSNKRTNFDIKPAYYKVCEKRFECVQP